MKRPIRSVPMLALCASFCAMVACAELKAPKLPERKPPAAVRWADQGLDRATRTWLHHAPLGEPALRLPLSWFFALEQPSLWVGEQPPFSDPSYLRRFGFLFDADDPTGLPVGFAVHETPADETGRGSRTLGLTCSACHTGQLEHDGVAFRFDGGPSSIALDRFERALALAVLETVYVPGREGRSITRIVGDEPSAEEIEHRERQLDQLADQVRARVDLRRAHPGPAEGFGRVDLTGRLTNELFAQQLEQAGDAEALVGAVRFPPLWNAPWFEWNGYTGTVQPLGPLLVTKTVGLTTGLERTAGKDAAGGAPRFRSPLDLSALEQLHGLLAGPKTPQKAGSFTGLRAPSWPEDLFGPIDRQAALAGERLYDALCLRCHLPPPNREDFFDPSYWTETAGGPRLRVPVVSLEEIGTDPLHAERLREGRVGSPLQDTKEKAPTQDVLLALSLAAAREEPTREGRPAGSAGPLVAPELAESRAPEGYRARPLDGAWATPPYLHNGSVPTLYALLSPLSERPARFRVGHTHFDPKRVGLLAIDSRQYPELDTSVPGNHNTGHLFDEGDGPGILGRRLSPRERRQLIEYIKTLESVRMPVGPGADPPAAYPSPSTIP